MRTALLWEKVPGRSDQHHQYSRSLIGAPNAWQGWHQKVHRAAPSAPWGADPSQVTSVLALRVLVCLRLHTDAEAPGKDSPQRCPHQLPQALLP